MSTSPSPTFLAALAQVHANLRPQAPSPEFLSNLARVHAALPVASDANLQFLADRFRDWRKATQELVRARLVGLSDDDPLHCPISLFRTMDYGRLETAHTRTLAWLLHPQREHGFGQALLAALLRGLSGRACLGEIRVDRVESELPIDGCGANGRLDVLAEGKWANSKRSDWVLVIEAKVDAGEGEDQIQKYDAWLKSNAAGREVFRVFLTPDGRPPEPTPDRRAPETGAEKWEPLSYLGLVRTFREVYGGLRHTPGFHFLRFYLAGVLQDVCRLPRNIGFAADPYKVASYLNAVHDLHTEGADYDAAR